MSLPTPPVVPGLPVVGNALAFRKQPVDLLQRGYEHFGPVFAIRLGPMRCVVIIGPENHQFFFAETDTTLSMADVYKAFVPIFGDGFTLAVGPEEYQEQRAILQPVFQPAKMGAYVETMVQESLAWLHTLGEEGMFDVQEALDRLTLNTVARALIGQDFRQRMGEDFWHLYRDVVGGIEFLLPHNLPLPRFRRRNIARRILHARIGAMIAERRAQPDGRDDFLQTLAQARYSNGKPVPESTLESMILFLVFSASESTPLQASWALIQMLQHPHYLTQVMDELSQVLDGAAVIDQGTLRQLVRLDWALKESERLRPMTTMLWRRTVKPYDLGGYHVPKGWITIICPAVSHRLPEVFPDPDRYDPERFSPARAEDRGTPFSLVGFGGGRHRCPGSRFAYSLTKVVFGLLLRDYALELVNPDPQPDYTMSIARPESPCLVRYRRRAFSQLRPRPTWAAAVPVV